MSYVVYVCALTWMVCQCMNVLSPAQYGQVSAIQLLLECGASLNSQDHHGNCALHFAAIAGHVRRMHTRRSLVYMYVCTLRQQLSWLTSWFDGFTDRHAAGAARARPKSMLARRAWADTAGESDSYARRDTRCCAVAARVCHRGLQ